MFKKKILRGDKTAASPQQNCCKLATKLMQVRDKIGGLTI